MTPPNYCRGQQPYWVPIAPAVGVGALPHGRITCFTTVSDESGAHTAIIAPVPNIRYESEPTTKPTAT